jgi:hypothetical protein
MTNHYDEMKVSPDPSQAEELRQLLHARMASVATDDPRGGSPLDLGSGGHPDEWIVPSHELSPPDTSTTEQRTHRRRALMVAAAVVVAVAAGGIAIRSDDPSGVATIAPTSTTSPTPTTPTTDGAPSNDGCPLTAEEVSTAIGVTITSNGFCVFGDVFPSVVFAYQPASACTRASLRAREGHYSKVDGFGVDAYVNRVSLGHTFIVCDGDEPFELGIDGVDGADRPIAIALAKLVRDD